MIQSASIGDIVASLQVQVHVNTFCHGLEGNKNIVTC